MILRKAWDGECIISLRQEDLEYPEGQTTATWYDVLAIIGVPTRETVFVDIIEIDSGRRMDLRKDVLWSKTYHLVRRACARCTMCNCACVREGAHLLCSHGGLEHVRHCMLEDHMHVVQGYTKILDGASGHQFSYAKELFGKERLLADILEVDPEALSSHPWLEHM